MADHRAQHPRLRILLLVLALLASLAARAEAKSYTAERYDSRVEVLRDGAFRVTETLVFRFAGGTFTEVFRQIPSRRTDGFEIERVAMDGVPLQRRSGPGGYTVKNENGPRLTWRFAPVSDSTHTFELTYLVRGVVWQDRDADVVAWKPLPTRHDYAIEASAFEVSLPAPPLAPPLVDVHRGTASTVSVEDAHVRVRATSFRSNGWMEVTLRLPRGSAIDAPPRWQLRQQQAAATAPIWLALAGLVLAVGLVAIFAIRQGYDSPPPVSAAAANGPAPPDTAPPAIAGALVSNGRPMLEHAMATLFALAERGDLQIAEEPRTFMQRSFQIVRATSSRRLSPHEQAAVDLAFTGKQPETEVSIATVRSRVTRGFKRFATAVRQELAEAGCLDAGREAIRKRFLVLAVVAFVLAGVAGVLAAVFSQRFAAWPLAIAGALVIVAISSLIAHAGHTGLSNEGLRRAREWRGFQRYAKELADDRASAPRGAAASLLPFAIAVGLAPAWAKYLEAHRSDVPDWFSAIDEAAQGEAFAAFVAVGGSSASHGSAGGGGAAGGGASGAH